MLAYFVISLIVLVIIKTIVVPTGKLGKFERVRRMEQLNTHSLEIDRDIYYTDIVSLQHALSALLLVSTVASSVVSFGWFLGVVIAAIVALGYGTIARSVWLRKGVMKYYYMIEPSLFHLIHQYPFITKYIRIFTDDTPEFSLHSREELHHVIKSSRGVLSENDKLLLLRSLDFSNRKVSDAMTPRSVIDSINRVELLGPLVLDELHKTGHSRFPVIENDIDHVVGILHLHDLLKIDSNKKHTSKVETLMEKRVFYIHEDQTLEHALTAFIKTRHHLFVVVNEYRETVGIISLEDVIEALLGRKIVDEFDEHDDLRKVAQRNLRGNNSAHKHEDV